MDSVVAAQQDMRVGYLHGIPGIIASGSVWCVAGLVAWWITPMAGIVTLIVGGTVIFPLSLLLCKLVGAKGRHKKGNPLAPLAIEGTLWMLFSIPVAVAAAYHNPEWFFPSMMLVIAGRYFTFSTLYGMRIYWIFSVALIVGGFVGFAAVLPVHLSALMGGGIELLFALIIYICVRRQSVATV